ncbi:hypothetical protein GCM10023067_41370 [Aminobacter aganoensis]
MLGEDRQVELQAARSRKVKPVSLCKTDTPVSTGADGLQAVFLMPTNGPGGVQTCWRTARRKDFNTQPPPGYPTAVENA